jgi:hypothetical protein
MGMNEVIIGYEEGVLKSLDFKYKGLSVCELGNQRIDKKIPSKKYYTKKGAEHTSIDLNGRDGSLPLDLEGAMPIGMKGKFRLVTNYGTLEHVNRQYEAFGNVNFLCAPFNGVMIHAFPMVGNWNGHCRYYYTPDFILHFAKLCRYNVFNMTILDKGLYKKPKNLLMVAMIKSYGDFISREQFDSISGMYDSGNKKRTGNYTI